MVSRKTVKRYWAWAVLIVLFAVIVPFVHNGWAIATVACALALFGLAIYRVRPQRG